VFGNWLSNFTSNAPANSNAGGAAANAPGSTAPSKPSGLSQAAVAADMLEDSTASPVAAASSKNAIATRRMQPTEVVLRGYRSPAQQYAAVDHYEKLAGRICEDYPREPPAEQRRYKSELRDRALTAARRLTVDERRCVNKAASGSHWVKITFESAEAADAALYASPQSILGHIVTAELWTGAPPAKDESVLDMDLFFSKVGRGDPETEPAVGGPWATGAAPRRVTAPHRRQILAREDESGTHKSASTAATLSDTPEVIIKAGYNTTTRTSDNSTRGSAGTTMDTITETPESPPRDPNFCKRIPTARRVQLLPAESAVLPGRTFAQWLLAVIPMLHWFTGSMIGDEVPRTELGDFDWHRASLYWKLIWWLDATFGLFGGEILSAADKDE
jgi:hypothetical protein